MITITMTDEQAEAMWGSVNLAVDYITSLTLKHGLTDEQRRNVQGNLDTALMCRGILDRALPPLTRAAGEEG